MLFGKSRDSSYSLPVLKHIAEIIVSGDPELFRKLRTVSAEEIISFLKSQNVSANTPLSQLRQYIKSLGYSAEFISWFDKELTTVMLNFKDYNLPYEYSRLRYVEAELRKKLERDIRKYIKNKRADFSDSDWSVISFDFSKFVEAHSSNYSYDPATNGILKFLINTFGFYMKSRSSFLMDMLNTTGMNSDVEGTDYSRADYQTVEVNYFEDLTGFDNLASDIYQASSFLYKHNHKIYYDLFSRYKFKRAEERFDAINALYNRNFRYTSLYSKPTLEDINFTVDSGRAEKYARNKARERDVLLSPLDALVEDKLGPTELKNAIALVEAYNRDIYSRYGTKEQMVVLETGDYHPKDGMSNDLKLKYMIMGMCALRDLIKYARKMKINIFKISSAIFKEERLIRRFKTFRQYRELYSLVDTLMNAEEEVSRDLLTNDQVYSDILESRNSRVRDIPLINIRDAIKEYSKSRAQSIVAAKQEPLIDVNRLNSTIVVYNRFTKAPEKGKTMEFPEKYSVVSKQIYPLVLGHLLQNKLLTSNDIYFQVDDSFDLKEFIVSKFSEGIYKEGIEPFIYPFDKNEDVTLSYLRTFKFVEQFLKYVEDTIKLLAANRNMSSDLRLYLLMNEGLERFTMPRDPIHNDEFEWFEKEYDISFYVPKGGELQDINGHLVSLYKTMHSEFADLFRYLEEIYRIRYVPLNNNFKLVEQYPYEVPERLLEDASLGIYIDPYPEAVGYDNLKRFKNFCTTDKYGFLFKRGSMYKKNYFGTWRYLHELGYWVTFSKNRYTKITISPTDVFEVE